MTRKLPLILAILAAVAAAPAARAANGVETVEAKAAFADVKQDVADAIVNRGYVIDYTARIGEMLDRTGADVGSTKKVYTGAETAQFCSAVLSRAMMEADPGNIAYCPYVVFYYERADAPGTVVVGYRALDEAGSQASAAAKKQINALLAEIVREAAGAK